MSSVFDVTEVEVNGGTSSIFTTNIESIDITVDDYIVDTVQVQVDRDIKTVQVEVPGVQGPPGTKNVYVQETDPSKDFEGNTIWGQAEKNYIWIKT